MGVNIIRVEHTRSNRCKKGDVEVSLTKDALQVSPLITNGKT